MTFFSLVSVLDCFHPLLQRPRPEPSPARYEAVVSAQRDGEVEGQTVSVDHGEDVDDDELAVRRLTENSQASRWDMAILLKGRYAFGGNRTRISSFGG